MADLIDKLLSDDWQLVHNPLQCHDLPADDELDQPRVGLSAPDRLVLTKRLDAADARRALDHDTSTELREEAHELRMGLLVADSITRCFGVGDDRFARLLGVERAVANCCRLGGAPAERSRTCASV